MAVTHTVSHGRCHAVRHVVCHAVTSDPFAPLAHRVIARIVAALALLSLSVLGSSLIDLVTGQQVVTPSGNVKAVLGPLPEAAGREAIDGALEIADGPQAPQRP